MTDHYKTIEDALCRSHFHGDLIHLREQALAALRELQARQGSGEQAPASQEYSKMIAEQVGINSLTHAETDATMSVRGVSDRGRIKPMTADRAAFFMIRFKREEKLLGPNEQAAVDFVIAMLNSQPAQPASAQKPLGWYCVDKTGMATLCADEDDAIQSAKLTAQDWPRNAPYIATQLYTAPSIELVQQARDALDITMDNLRPHGENCFLHDDGGEYDACFCGKDTLVSELVPVIIGLDAWLEANK